MYIKRKYWCACQAQHKKHLLELEWCCCLSFSFQESCFRECHFENSIGKSSSMSKFLLMRHQSRMQFLVWWFCCILNTMKRLFKTEWIVISCRNALESQNGINCSIIDDSYSSDFQSLK
jgi:hypothetical protein